MGRCLKTFHIQRHHNLLIILGKKRGPSESNLSLCRNSYEARQEDELSLQENDLVNVLRKMPDGWFFGERIKDGAQGWFPSSYVTQVVNDHVRANNYRQRLRIIQTANKIQQSGRIQDKRISLAGIHAPPLKDRFRRLSNPRTFFIN